MGNLPTAKKNIQYISLLRVTATIAVIFLHTCSTVRDRLEVSYEQYLFFDTIISLMRWSVPIFFMITGILLLDDTKKITIRDTYKKYAFRMVLALIVFGIPFSIMEIFMETKQFSLELIWKAVINIINGDSWNHLWYLYVLIGLYLVLPLLKSFYHNSAKAEIRFFLVVLLIFDFIVPIMDELIGTDIAFSIPVTYPVFYVILGKYLSDNPPRVIKYKTYTLLLLAGTCVLVFLIEVTSLEHTNGLTAYNSVLTVWISMLVFWLFRGSYLPEKWQTVLWRIDRLCFGVYLIHPVFIHLMYKLFKITPISFKWYRVMTIVFLCGFVMLSFAMSWIMSLIKPLKKYIL